MLAGIVVVLLCLLSLACFMAAWRALS